jgi:hypothetical protein
MLGSAASFHPKEGQTGGNMKRIMFLGIALASGLLAAPTFAANITASGVISSKPDGANFDYTIDLTNSSASTAPIGTFWYAWIAVPFEDFLPTKPISVTAPTGWSAKVTNIGASDGYGIEYTANSSADAIQPGSSLNFLFTSADKPAAVNGDSPFYPGTPVGTSVVYQMGAFNTPTDQFVVQAATSSVPEPSSLTLGIFGVFMSIAVLRARRGKGLSN